jgi:hypothetical protein
MAMCIHLILKTTALVNVKVVVTGFNSKAPRINRINLRVLAAVPASVPSTTMKPSTQFNPMVPDTRIIRMTWMESG